MKQPKGLTRSELVKIVEQVRDTLYFNAGFGPDFTPGLDPDNDFEGDMLDAVAQILSAYDLTPSEFVPMPEEENSSPHHEGGEELSTAEVLLMGDLLRISSDHFAHHGCNDYDLNDTPDNRQIMQAVGASQGDERYGCELYFRNGFIAAHDCVLMEYFAGRCHYLVQAKSKKEGGDQ